MLVKLVPAAVLNAGTVSRLLQPLNMLSKVVPAAVLKNGTVVNETQVANMLVKLVPADVSNRGTIVKAEQLLNILLKPVVIPAVHAVPTTFLKAEQLMKQELLPVVMALVPTYSNCCKRRVPEVAPLTTKIVTLGDAIRMSSHGETVPEGKEACLTLRSTQLRV